MARNKKSKRRKIRERDLQAVRQFEQLAPLLERLHEVGTERDRAGNRQLHFDQYCMLILLFLFNPIVDSLRGIQQASELEKVQRQLGAPRTSLGSLSEATDVFDPERLKEIIAELGAQLPPLGHAPGLEQVQHLITAVDGTLIKTLSRLAGAAFMKSPHDGTQRHAFRLHTQFDVDRHVPLRIDVTGGASRGEQDERYVLGKNLAADHCYVMIRTTPHENRGTARGHESDGFLRIATNLLDVPADVIALIYRYRWTIEIFFRFFKHLLGCRHLLSSDPVGVEIQTYCAIIACLLISLWTGRQPTKRTYEMICWYLIGWASQDELLAHLSKLKKHDD